MVSYKVHEDSWQGDTKQVFQKQFVDPNGNMLRITYTEAENERMPCGEDGCGQIDLYLKENRTGSRKNVMMSDGGTDFWGLYTDLITREHNNINHSIQLKKKTGSMDVEEYAFHNALTDNIPEMMADPEVSDSFGKASYSRPGGKSVFK
jgi:hypothetical protein